MKKALSLILSVVMLISVMAGLNVTAFAGSVVDKVDIYNVPEPVAGAQPDFMAQQYDVYDRNGVVDKYVFSSGYYRDGIAWYDFTEGTYVNPNDSTYVYKCGHTYKASFTVYIPDTQGGNILFEYPTRMDVTVNGNTAVGVTDKKPSLSCYRDYVCYSVLKLPVPHKPAPYLHASCLGRKLHILSNFQLILR